MEANLNGLEIINKEQFEKVYFLFRSANRMSFEEWLKKYSIPILPIYLEKLGNSYGYTTEIKYEIIKFDESLLTQNQ